METDLKVGPVGQAVAENVKAYRSRRRMSLRELSAKLKEQGRPILPSGITKIEHGERRVDADDLVALAIAFNVSPARLLLPGGEATENFLSEIDRYERSGVLEPLTRVIFTAVDQHLISPAWLLEYVEFAPQFIGILQEGLGPSSGELTTEAIHESMKRFVQTTQGLTNGEH
jgi:transcriptional regulator with XRE-family HTH domain